MITKNWAPAILLTSACLSIGCTYGDTTDIEGDEGVAEAAGALLDGNGIDFNGIDFNGIDFNGIDFNALDYNALNSTTRATIEASTSKGALARQVLKYMVSCGLDTTQSFSFTWYDADSNPHPETFYGALGLTKDWPTKPLSPSEREWMSACLISRVNYYGATVMLSSRAAHVNLQNTDPAELAAYTQNEGAFWGDLFANPPTAYSCNNVPTIGYARAASRDCAAGHLNLDGTTSNCGMITIVGDCTSHCTAPDPAEGYYPFCGETTNGQDKTKRAITVFLP